MAFDQAKYQREQMTVIKMTLNKDTNPNLIAWVRSQPNITEYLRGLITADMISKGVETDAARENKYAPIHVYKGGPVPKNDDDT